MPTIVPDPPEVGGVEAALETGKESPQHNVGTMARKGTWRASARRSMPIHRNPDPYPSGPKQGNRQRSHYANVMITLRI